MQETLVFLLLFLALLIGFLLGLWHAKRTRANSVHSNLHWPQKRYYEGLTQELNDQPDAAIDTFIAALDVNNETLETHLALGSFLRKRGEVSRAIRIHQNLLAGPGLSRQQMRCVQLELAIDYIKAGLMDRAELILKELIHLRDIEADLRTQATHYLIDVYQGLQDWVLAIDTASRLTSVKFGRNAGLWREKQAQFSCEIADAAIENKDWLSARRALRSAIRFDPNCVRASLLIATLESAQHEYTLALAALRKVPEQNHRFAAEILAPMFECYKKTNKLKALHNELQALYQNRRELIVLRYFAKAKEAVEGGEAVVALLMQELPHYPEMDVAAELLNLVVDERGPKGLRNYVRVKGVLEKLTDARQKYLCAHCGFEGKHIHWLCPGCKSWATISLVPNEAQNQSPEVEPAGTGHARRNQ